MFQECCDFIASKFPNIRCDDTNLNEMKIILKKLIVARVIYLTENGNTNEDLMNDLELTNLEDYYGMISRKMYYYQTNNSTKMLELQEYIYKI